MDKQGGAASKAGMEEVEAVNTSDFVDINGRSVFFLKTDDGALYVNLEDIKTAGFSVFPRKHFENASLSNEVVLKEVEAKIMHYGMQCLLETHRVFRENEIIKMMERVKAVVFNNKSLPVAGLAQSGLINNPQETNYKLSVGTTSLQDKKPKQLPYNFQPQLSNWYQRTNTSRVEECRKRAAVSEGSPPRVEQTDAVSNAFERRFATRGKSSIKFANVDPPNQESQNVQISNVSRTENIGQLSRVTLENGCFELRVTHLLSDKPIFYAQLLENNHLVDQIMFHVNLEDALLPVIAKPKKDMLVVVQLEEIWYRGVVIREPWLTGSAIVELLDFGNREQIEGDIRQMPEEMKEIPAQALRFTVNNHSTVSFAKLEIDEAIAVIVNEQFETQETTYSVDIKRILGFMEEMDTSSFENQSLENVKPSPKPAAINECFMEIAKASTKIVPGETVFIINHTEDKLIVKNKEMVALTKKITSLVASMQKKFVTDPKVGQYVLCYSSDFGDDFFRAIIKEINGKVASLELIDFSIEKTLAIKSLCNIDVTLASLPPAHIEIDYPPLKKVTGEGLTLLNVLITEKIKLTSIEVNGQIDFTVHGELLEKQLSPTKSDATPSPIHREPTVRKNVETVKAEPVATVVKNKEYVKVVYEDMICDEPKPGLNYYSCYLNSGATLTLVNVSEETAGLIDRLYVEEPEDNEPYKADLFEMCLAKYEDAWCRAMPTDEEDDVVEVMFVDYGNVSKVTKEDIRKFPEDFKNIPILGICAEFKNIKVTEAIYMRLKELIEDGAVLNVDVKVEEKKPNGFNYPVEIPAIYEILKKEGFI